MENFWSHHTILILIGFTLFPRIALLFCNIQSSFLFWIGWFFLPRIVIAIYATIFYLETNPILVILSWIIALSGESAEKSYSYKIKNKKFNQTRTVDYEVINE